jgi:hypothetical protein
MPVPLGVAVFGAPGWDRIDTPVNENTELGIGEPGRIGALVEGFPSGFIGLGKQGEGRQSGKEERIHGFLPFRGAEGWCTIGPDPRRNFVGADLSSIIFL